LLELPEHVLQPGERLRAQARGVDAHIAATDRRLVVVANENVALDVPYSELRRVQFDLERSRPATFVVVPSSQMYEARIVDIPWNEIPNVAAVLSVLSEVFTPLPEKSAPGGGPASPGPESK
jgi:hypothetical protein